MAGRFGARAGRTATTGYGWSWASRPGWDRAVVGVADAPATSMLRMRLVGTFAVSRAGRPLAPTEVGSRKARTLLALLAVARHRTLSTDRIVEVLWPEVPPRRPEENVATLVSRLRAVLGSAAIVGGRTGYRLGDALRVDLDEGAGLVAEAEARLRRGEPALAVGPAWRALELLDGEVLEEEPDAAWAALARARHVDLVRRGRHVAVEAALRTGWAADARLVAEAGLAADVLDEVSCRALMRAHDAAGEPARALLVYERVRVALAEELGVDPAPATRALHVAILRRGSRSRRTPTDSAGPPPSVRVGPAADAVGAGA